MDPMDFFNGKTIVKRITLHEPGRKLVKPEGMDALDRRLKLNPNMHSYAPSAGPEGTSYADEFIKNENERLYMKSLTPLTKVANDQMDTVSLVTSALADSVLNEDVDRLVSTYSFRRGLREKKMTISSIKDDILSMVNTNPVVIIQGPTGCGKTTQVPQYILENSFKKKLACNIVVTQPRRIAAISIAKRVCEERNWELGGLVGYKVGLASHTSPDTRLTYCTTGVLLHRLIKQKNLNDFTHIIIDEVHERDQDMDFLLLIVRKFLRTNSHSVRIILMSATINVDKFAKYFSLYLGENLTQAPIIDVVKRNIYDVHDFYLEDLSGIAEQPVINYDEPTISPKMYVLCKKLILMLDEADCSSTMNKQDITDRPTVLVFLPGIHEIEEMHSALLEANYESWEIVILHSLVTNSEQSKIFEDVNEGIRRVILSTNVAESSLTVPNVKYVIDFCLTKQLITNPDTNFQGLELTWASKANCQQRAGRTGRVMAGRVYRLIPRSMYNQELPDENPPEILRAPLTNVFLKAKVMNMEKPHALLALSLDPPDLKNLCKAVLTLKETGALLIADKNDDPFDGEITDLGKIMAELPVDVHITKLIMLGHVFSVLQDAIVMGASMSVKNMFSSHFQKKISSHNAKLYWAQNTGSDGIAFNSAYRVWRSKKANLNIRNNSEEISWARRNYLEIRVLREVDVLIQEITERLARLGIIETVGENKVVWTGDRKIFILKVITAGAFYPHYYLTEPLHDEKSMIKFIGGLDPTKTVYLHGWQNGQPGMLYAKRIQELFNNCKDSKTNKIIVQFDNSSRVFVQFGNAIAQDHESLNTVKNDTKNNDIPLAIYQAIKMRKVSDKNMIVPVMEPNSSIRRAKELDIETKIFYLPQDEPLVSSRYIEIRPKLPSLDTLCIPLKIKHVINPGHFWASLSDMETNERYKLLENYLSTLPADNFIKFDREPSIGSFVLGPYNINENKKIYQRGLLQHITRNSTNKIATVFFIDFGTIRHIPIDDLRRLSSTNKIRKIPALVFQCVLTNVKPSLANNVTGEWTDESKQVFNKLIKNKNDIYGNVYSVVDSVVSINLVYSDKSDETVNEYLLKNKYAEYREESFLSKKNHEIRQKYKELSSIEKSNYEEKQYNQLYLADTYVEPPSVDECTRTIKLHGPYSPLEVKLHDLTNVGMGMKVIIHETSVNSVLLDGAIDETQSRLVVAANISQSSTSNLLTLRNTTLMPRIPGLVGLLSLIFAPKIELRANAQTTRNIGVLCGLGYSINNSLEKLIVYPEHDMYIDFDVDISTNDLQNINRLRYWMSMGIFTESNPENSERDINDRMLNIQNNVKKFWTEIIDTKREPVNREYDLKHYKWCRYSSSKFIQARDSDKFNKIIFPLHRALILRQQDLSREILMAHVEELRTLSGQKSSTFGSKLIECKLCNEEVYGIMELRKHIFSVDHRALESKLRAHFQ
ncbi:probable ATP-dependent RNA helicase spindle-E [Aphidius gifuensis]|uniref:probable ATP-dependent RNA helicase spindle-E n=1 Tax=Aphidius gifuensis TaxID=684658 RepID=UPI001CDC5D38|nr:probable ATP-dependent RNA helicase spindle-E [Aphidius gifuensis]XP_044009649.1 probable ATP-dependent RNA helicase spindle-E [Aphidius gifuensis]